MKGITLSHLNGRLARRLFTVLIVSAVLPVAVASTLVLWQLNSLADQRKMEQLLDSAKSAGMAVFSELSVASVVLENFAARLHQDARGTESASQIEGVNGSAVNLFIGIEAIDATGLDGHLAAKRLPRLGPRERQTLDKGKSLLLWSKKGDDDAAFYLLRVDANGDHAVIGRLRNESFLLADATLPRDATLSVFTSSGTLLYNSGTDAWAPPAAMPLRELETWSADGQRREGVAWELFLQAGFGASPLRFVVTQPATSMAQETGRIGMLLPATLVLALILGLWLAVTQIRHYLGPLQKLTEGTRRLASRRFDEPIRIDTGDELGELGASFNDMASSLERQFIALKSMSEIDRLLLDSPGLEQVIDALLPRVAEVTRCEAVSVLILDTDAPDHARSYDLAKDSPGPLPVRRVAFDASTLSSLPIRKAFALDAIPEAGSMAWLQCLRSASCVNAELWPLSHRDALTGLLCLGYSEAREASEGKSYGHDFADRLTVALTNFRHEERLYRQANFDVVTGLANRNLLRERLAAALETGGSRPATGAMLYIDLDDFKRVNDSAGHNAGDELLRIVAMRLRACAREGDTVARLGGDEFVLLSPSACDADTALLTSERIIERVSQCIEIEGAQYFVSASVGIVMLFSDGMTGEELLRNGDIAMYRAKETGRGRAVFFATDMHDRTRNRAALEAGMRRALANGEFEVHYQPIHDRSSLVGAEALVRWRDPAGELLNPGLFIPVAEESGLIVEIGMLILRTVCRHWQAWKAQDCSPAYLSINVSPRQLRQVGFVDGFLAVLREHGVPGTVLQLEVTESVVAEGPEALAALEALSAAGLSIALDDFGTGYSSLSYLRRFPIDVVKVDRSFVVDLPDNAAACRLVETIIGMAHSLGKKVVAEGVETAEQRDFLLSRRCDRLQGYLLGKPVPAAEFNVLLKESRSAVPGRRAIA